MTTLVNPGHSCWSFSVAAAMTDPGRDRTKDLQWPVLDRQRMVAAGVGCSDPAAPWAVVASAHRHQIDPPIATNTLDVGRQTRTVDCCSSAPPTGITVARSGIR
jgi:hypothetical protein